MSTPTDAPSDPPTGPATGPSSGPSTGPSGGAGKDDVRPAPRHTDWGARVVLALIGVIVLAVAVLLGITVLPRWWAHRVGAVADGSLTAGIFAGLTCGAVFTAIPLLLLRLALGPRRAPRHRSLQARLVWLLVAVIAAVPNLTTLMIVLGTGNAAHAGERTMDVDAPGFRGATLIGAVLGAVLVVALWVMLFSRGRRKRELAQLRADRDRRAALDRAAQDDAATRAADRAREEHIDERERTGGHPKSTQAKGTGVEGAGEDATP